MLCQKTAARGWWRREPIFLAVLLALPTALQGLSFREDFDQPGQPPQRHGLVWDYRAELSPVTQWTEIIPGDGYAYLSAEREFLKRRQRPWGFWPFQTLSFGPVGTGHRITMRAKNTAIPGLAGMIFTYREQDAVDEIDFEITATDTESAAPRHKTGPEGGWTDLRLATWIGADKHHPLPTTIVKQPARDRDGEKMSLQDDRFHVYAIEWDKNEVRFLIDEVLQHTIEDTVPDQPAQVIFGLRQMPWAGDADWQHPQTMTVDWISIEPLQKD